MAAEAIKMAEIKHIVSDFHNKKMKINEAFHSLQREKQDLEDMHKILEDALLQSNRKISEKSVDFAEQLRQNISESEKRLNNTGKQVTDAIEKKIDHLSLFIQSSKKLLNRIKDEMRSFETEMNRTMNFKMDELIGNQSLFQKSVMNHITETVTEKTNRIVAMMENNTLVKIDEFIGRQDVLVENMTQQFNFYEKRISELKSEIDDIRKEQRRKDEKIAGFMKKLSQKQTAHQNAIKKITQTLRSVETEVNRKIDDVSVKLGASGRKMDDLSVRMETFETNGKKGFFSSRKKKPVDPV